MDAFLHAVWVIVVVAGMVALFCCRLWAADYQNPRNRAVRYPTPDTARQVQKLVAVANFNEAVIALRVNASLSAWDKLVALAGQYHESLIRMDNAGELSPTVQLEFRIFAEQSAHAITGLTADFGAGLHDLLRHYDPSRFRLH